MQIGRKIYYDLATGNVIIDTGERQGSVIATTIDQDIATFTALSERNRETFDVIELEYGQLSQDFAECVGYSVDVDLLATLAEDERWKAIKFTMPDPNNPDVPITVEKPLSVQIDELKELNKTASEKYAELDLATADLATVKQAKLAQLRELCSLTIKDGFTYDINGVTYRFSCDNEAQANFQGSDSLFKDGLITTVDWTVQEGGVYKRITIDKDTFNSLKLEVFKCINTNVSKLRDVLQPQVEAAVDNSEVDAVVW